MSRIGNGVVSQQHFRGSLQLAALGDMLPDGEIELICQELGHSWRDRQLPPGITVRSMVHRALNADRTIAAGVDNLVANGDVDEGLTDSAWCQARSRLPEAAWVYLMQNKAHELRDRVGEQYLWFGRPVFRIDGSTLSMPDVPELAEAFGYAPGTRDRSRFPVARISFMVLAGVEGIWDYRLDPYRVSEKAQLEDMWHTLPTGCVCVFDVYFSSFYILAKLRQRRVGVVTPLHHRRDPQELIRRGKQIGPNEWIVTLDLAPSLRKKYADPTLPKRMQVRLIRVHVAHGRKRGDLWLVTTLMDPVRYPAKAIAKLYRGRWGVETRIGSVKVTLALTVLRSKKEDHVRKEVAAALLAHNLVWTLIHQAARQTGTPADRISFARAVRIVTVFSEPLRDCPPEQRPCVYQRMLNRMAARTNPLRPNRVEPRQVKRDPVKYPFLTVSRAEARAKCLT